MAYKDPSAPLVTVSLDPEPEQDPILAKADRLFAELAREMDMAEPDMLISPAEEWTLVYDKFSGRRR